MHRIFLDANIFFAAVASRSGGSYFILELAKKKLLNATTAQEVFPLRREEAERLGFKWKPSERTTHTITIPHNQIPSSSKEITDVALNAILGCEHEGSCTEQCSFAFKVTSSELEFYRKMDLPLPHLCPNCRHYQRIKQRNPLKLWHRKCTYGGTASENGVYKNQTTHFHGSGPWPMSLRQATRPTARRLSTVSHVIRMK